MIKRVLKIWTVLGALMLCLLIPTTAKAADFDELEEYVNTKDLAVYLSSEYDKGTEAILLGEYEIPAEFWDEVISLFSLARPEIHLSYVDAYSRGEYLYSLRVTYTDEDLDAIRSASTWLHMAWKEIRR